MSKFSQGRRRGSVRGALDSSPYGAPSFTVNDNAPYVLLVLEPGDPPATTYDVERKVESGPWLPLATLVSPTWDYEDSERLFDGTQATTYRGRAHEGAVYGSWGYSDTLPTDPSP